MESLLAWLLETPPVGWALGALDRAYYLQRALGGAGRPRLFSRGWGEELSAVMAEYDAVIGRLRAGRPPYGGDGSAPPLAGLAWEDELPVAPIAAATGGGGGGSSSSGRVVRRFVARHGAAPSPLAHVLPPGPPRTLRFLYVSDTGARLPWDDDGGGSGGGGGLPPPATVAVVLPATGEQGYADRLGLARALLARLAADGHGPSAAVLVMAPLYAARKATDDGQLRHYVTSVGRYQAQSLAVMAEGAALAGWAHAAFAPAGGARRLVLTGFSWGAAMAGCAALLASALLPPGEGAARVVAVPYVGSCSPEPVVAGVLADDVDWAALEADALGGRGLPGGDVRAALRTQLAASHTRLFVDALTAAPGAGGGRRGPLLAGCLCVGMVDDGFVPLAFSAELAALLGSVTAPAAAPAGQKEQDDRASLSRPPAAQHRHFRTYRGGHVVAYVARPWRQVDAVADALRAAAAVAR
jgi:hypothetical protein